MHICKTALALIARHRSVLLIYVLVISLAGYLMGRSVSSPSAASADEGPALKAAVIDRDGSVVSRAIARHVEDACEMVEVEDSTFSLQDAAARDVASFVLVIPEGYGDALISAAREGGAAPELEYVVSYQSARGALVSERVSAYAQRLANLAAASDASADELARWADEVQRERAKVVAVETEQTMFPTSYLVYCTFATYPLFGGVAAVVATGLAGMRREEMRRRLAASSVPARSQAVQTGLAILLVGLLVWAANAALGLVLFRVELAGVPLALMGLALFALLPLGLVGAAFGFLLWQVGASLQTAHAASNIVCMVLSFLSGAWVSIDQMGEAPQMAGRLTPCYWTVDALTHIARSTQVTGELVRVVAADAALVALFALALAAVVLALGKARA